MKIRISTNLKLVSLTRDAPYISWLFRKCYLDQEGVHFSLICSPDQKPENVVSQSDRQPASRPLPASRSWTRASPHCFASVYSIISQSLPQPGNIVTLLLLISLSYNLQNPVRTPSHQTHQITNSVVTYALLSPSWL